MKSMMSLLAALSVFSLLTAASIAGESMPGAKTEPNAGFEKLKPLVGNWQGKANDGKPVKISYALVSGGSALVETIQAESEPGMVTVYHPDGDRLMMTH